MRGALRCWGQRAYDLPDAPSSEDEEELDKMLEELDKTHLRKPTKVAELPAATQLALGAFHSCALAKSGKVYCWGNNSGLQLGDGKTQSRSKAMAVNGIEKATRIALGDNHGCALLQDGKVRCWGANDRGQLGKGDRKAAKAAVASRVWARSPTCKSVPPLLARFYELVGCLLGRRRRGDRWATALPTAPGRQPTLFGRGGRVMARIGRAELAAALATTTFLALSCSPAAPPAKTPRGGREQRLAAAALR